jgi:hypothetical protein
MLSLALSDVQDGKPIEIEEHRLILPFYVSQIPAFSTCQISVQPQLPFLPRRLVYGGEKNLFLMEDLKVGKNSQTVSAGSMPMECFPPHPIDGEPIDNLLGVERCLPYQMMTMTIRNLAPRTVSFGAIIYGAI